MQGSCSTLSSVTALHEKVCILWMEHKNKNMWSLIGQKYLSPRHLQCKSEKMELIILHTAYKRNSQYLPDRQMAKMWPVCQFMQVIQTTNTLHTQICQKTTVIRTVLKKRLVYFPSHQIGWIHCMKKHVWSLLTRMPLRLWHQRLCDKAVNDSSQDVDKYL